MSRYFKALAAGAVSAAGALLLAFGVDPVVAAAIVLTLGPVAVILSPANA